MNLYYKKIALALSLAVFFVPLLALAQNSGFTPLAPIPGTDANADLPTFLNSWFRIGVGVAAFLAVIMIAIGGFEYMGSEGVTNKEAGRSRMMNAVYGLLLILASVIILQLINPDILNLKIGKSTLAPFQTTPTQNTQGGLTQEQIQQAADRQGGAGTTVIAKLPLNNASIGAMESFRIGCRMEGGEVTTEDLGKPTYTAICSIIKK